MWVLASCSFPEPVERVKLAQAEVARIPNWRIESAAVGDCEDPDPECARSVCTVRSLERGPTTAELSFRLTHGADAQTLREAYTLEPGETRELVHEFAVVDVSLGQTHGRCDLVASGVRLVCGVSNEGEQEHLVTVIGQLLDRAGRESDRRTARVTLQPGERRDVAFEFDDRVDAGGQCALE
ncbi:MAG: hypothetical protein ABMA64_38365 [Myxococcota bacterium]